MRFPPIHPGDDVSAEHAAHIIGGLKMRALPKPEWTHGAHHVAAVMLLDELGRDGALAAMPDMIRRYNLATGGVNTDTEGYHHTLTVFYLCVIDEHCRRLQDAPPYMRATKLLSSPRADRAYPLQFYTKDLLFSVRARREFIAPDIKPFPGQQ